MISTANNLVVFKILKILGKTSFSEYPVYFCLQNYQPSISQSDSTGIQPIMLKGRILSSSLTLKRLQKRFKSDCFAPPPPAPLPRPPPPPPPSRNCLWSILLLYAQSGINLHRYGIWSNNRTELCPLGLCMSQLNMIQRIQQSISITELFSHSLCWSVPFF